METKEIDIEEPELFFQKKYGIVSIKREPLLIEINKSSDPRNSSFEEHIDSSWGLCQMFCMSFYIIEKFCEVRGWKDSDNETI